MVRDAPGEQLRFFRTKDLPGVEVMTAYGSLEPWHVFHETYAFCACRTAASEFRYRRGTHSLNDGSLMLLEPGEVHFNTVVRKRSDFKVIFISPAVFESIAREMDIPGTPHFCMAENDDPQLFAALHRLGVSMESNDTLLRQQELLDVCAHRLLGLAERKPRPVGSGNEHLAVARAKAYLEDRCHEAVSLDELSAVAGISRFRLVHVFSKEIGLPPHAYQIHVRIARAVTSYAGDATGAHCDRTRFCGPKPLQPSFQTGFAGNAGRVCSLGRTAVWLSLQQIRTAARARSPPGCGAAPARRSRRVSPSPAA